MRSRATLIFGLLVASCSAPAPKNQPASVGLGQTTFGVSGDETPPLPSDFTPPPQLPEPIPIDPRLPGANYLEKVGAQISPRWASFLDDLRLRLSPHHELNRAELSAVIGFVVLPDGQLGDVSIVRGSGEAAFDKAALEILGDAAPLLEPDAEVLGDDDVARIQWLFARDARQAGPGTARIVPVRLPAGAAVPRLLARGDSSAAARRVAEAKNLSASDQALLLDAVARAVIVRASGRGDVRAIEQLDRKGVVAIEELLIEKVQTVGAPAREQALAALGRVGHPEAASLAAAIARDSTSSDAMTAVASSVWSSAGQPARAEIALGVGELLESTDPLRRRRAFVIGGAVPLYVVGKAAVQLLSQSVALELVVPSIARLAADGDHGAISTVARELASRVGERRAAFSTALAAMRAKLPRRLRGAVIARLRDPDERVRAAALLTVKWAWPTRVGKFASKFRGESSPLVLSALAEALADDPSNRATRALASLLESKSGAVVAAAARGLWGRKNAPSILARYVDSKDERVARAALVAREREKLAELCQSGGSLAADAFAALLALGTEPTEAAHLLAAASEATELEMSIAWLGSRKRARLGG